MERSKGSYRPRIYSTLCQSGQTPRSPETLIALIALWSADTCDLPGETLTPGFSLQVYKGFSMKGIVAAAVAIAMLWVADVEFNGGRYSGAVLRAVENLIGR